jgi:hypothetical protein
MKLILLNTHLKDPLIGGNELQLKSIFEEAGKAGKETNVILGRRRRSRYVNLIN